MPRKYKARGKYKPRTKVRKVGKRKAARKAGRKKVAKRKYTRRAKVVKRKYTRRTFKAKRASVQAQIDDLATDLTALERQVAKEVSMHHYGLVLGNACMGLIVSGVTDPEAIATSAHAVARSVLSWTPDDVKAAAKAHPVGERAAINDELFAEPDTDMVGDRG